MNPEHLIFTPIMNRLIEVALIHITEDHPEDDEKRNDLALEVRDKLRTAFKCNFERVALYATLLELEMVNILTVMDEQMQQESCVTKAKDILQQKGDAK